MNHETANRGRAICFPFLGRSLGGAHLSTLPLIRNLPAPYRPLIVVHHAGAFTDLLEREGLPYRVLPILHTPNSDTSRWSLLAEIGLAMPRLAAFLRRERVAVIHGNDGRMNVTWGPAARLTGVPFLWHQRSRYQPSRFAHPFFRLADTVVAISRFCGENLPGAVRDRIRVVIDPFEAQPTTPDRAQARQALVEEFNLPAEAQIAVYMSNFIEKKRPAAFVAILGEALRRAPSSQIHGLMFGVPREPWGGEVRARIEAEGLGGRIRIAGFRHPPEPMLAGADVLIAPAINEGYGRTLVEAMQVGTPVIASAHGGHLDVLEDGVTGFLVPPGDHAAFAAAVLRLLGDDSEHARIAAAATARARSAYSVSAHVAAITRAYDDLLGRDARRRRPASAANPREGA